MANSLVSLPAKLCIVLTAMVAIPGCGADRPGDLVDDARRSIQLRHAVRRVITLAPNLTESVALLGGEPLIVGTDDFSDYPPPMKGKPKVGGVHPNLESIASLHPDLVIASTSANHPALAPALEALSIPLYVVRTDRLSDIARAMGSLGSILKLPDHQKATQSFRRDLEAQRRRRRIPPKVLFIVWTDPLYVAGSATYMDDLFELTGAENAASRVSGWPPFSFETLVTSQPDILLFPSRSIPPAQFELLIRKDARWRNLKCIREHSYFAVDEDVFTRPGPRVVEAARALNRIVDDWERR